MSKKCELINDKFSWVMKVDGKIISFQGAGNADYFAAHYKELGYKIEWDKNKRKEKLEINRVI